MTRTRMQIRQATSHAQVFVPKRLCFFGCCIDFEWGQVLQDASRII